MPPKSLRSSVAGSAANSGISKTMSQLSDRINLLEKRYSTVMIHQTYFKILDEWVQCMFGTELFPKKDDMDKESEKSDADAAADNPFYELHMLHQRVNFIEDELQSMGIDVPQLMPKKNTNIATSPASGKSPPKRSYGSSVLRRRSIISPSKHVPTRPPILKPVATAMASAAAVAIAASAAAAAAEKEAAIKEEKTENGVAAAATDGKDKDENVPAPPEKEDKGEKTAVIEEEKDKPPVLEEIKIEPEDDEDMEEEEVEAPTPDDNSKSRPSSAVSNDIKTEVKMEVDDEQMEEEEEEEEDIDDIEYAVGRYAEKKIRETVGKRKSANVVEEEPQVVTYTTRGRRHTLPRRYAEFTGHDNVASILKSQQRAGGNTTPKVKKIAVEPKPKTPSKPKPPPKIVTPKKADGTRPECVYNLITHVQGKQVDSDGNVTLWDPIPSVKVNQQQLISVIFRSNGMATRLTRKLTTLVFEDQVLANTSPFGTKYYQERLPPEPLEAMVEFICNSDFDANHTKKKIYMVVGQVCNEARAGRVRKLVPSGSVAAPVGPIITIDDAPSTSTSSTTVAQEPENIKE